MSASLQPDYFDEIYEQDPDPWQFETSAYERAKYDTTLAALPQARYASAFEVGCSIGVLTERLAARCDRLLAVDVAARALTRARARTSHLPHVAIAAMQIPASWPAATFDLILFSEVLYYQSPIDLAETARRTRASLKPGGAALLVHYTLPTSYPLYGDQATVDFIALTGMKPILQLREARYRLDLLRA